MSLNTQTIAWLKTIKKNFPEIAQAIFEKTYLTPYANKTLQPIFRPHHGAQHASRVAALVRILVNFCRNLGYPKEIVNLSEEEIILLQLVALFHDAGRTKEGKDVDEDKSAELFKKFLEENGIDDPAAFVYADYINHKLADVIGVLFESADAMDIPRVRRYVQIEKIPLFAYLNPTDRTLFVELVVEAANKIKAQGDLSTDCGIYLYGQQLYSLSEYFDNDTKLTYEHHSNCYQFTIKNFQRSDIFRAFYNSNKRMRLAQIKYLASPFFSKMEMEEFEQLFLNCEFLITENEDFILTFTTEITHQRMLAILSNKINLKKTNPLIIESHEWEKLINLLRQGNPAWHVHDDFYIKVVRPAKFACFIKAVTSAANKDFSIRNVPKKSWTVTGQGVFARCKTSLTEESNLKMPQYSKEQKTDFSQVQSVSLAWPDHSPPLFQFSSPCSLVAVAFPKADVLLSHRLYVYEGKATQYRPSDFELFSDAQRYFQEMRKRGVIFSAEEVDAFKASLLSPAYSHHYNEVMARLRLSDNVFVLVGSDTLGARLLAQAYAALIRKKLAEKYGTNNYQVPILFYFPAMKELHYRYYTFFEQHVDQLTARAYLSCPKLRTSIYNEGDFDITLGLSEQQLPQIFRDFLSVKKVPQYIVSILIDKVDIVKWAKEAKSINLLLLLCFALKHAEILAVHHILRTSKFVKLYLFAEAVEKYNPLILACLNREQEIAILLIANKSYPVNMVDSERNTALHIAIKEGLFEVVEALLERKDIKCNLLNENGQTAIDLARASEEEEIVELLPRMTETKSNLRF